MFRGMSMSMLRSSRNLTMRWEEARCGAAAEMITHPSEIRQIALTLLEADPEITTLYFAMTN